MPPLGPLSPGNPSPTPSTGTCRTARDGGKVKLPEQLTRLVRSPGQGRPGPGPPQDLGEQGHRAVARARQPAGSSPVCWAQARARAKAQSTASCLQPTPIAWRGRRPQGQPLRRDLSLQEPFVAPELAPAPVASREWAEQSCGSARPGKQWALALVWLQLETSRSGRVCQVGPGFLRAPQVLASGILLLDRHPKLALSTSVQPDP